MSRYYEGHEAIYWGEGIWKVKWWKDDKTMVEALVFAKIITDPKDVIQMAIERGSWA